MLELQLSKDSLDRVPGHLQWTKETQFHGGFGERILEGVCPAEWKAPRCRQAVSEYRDGKGFYLWAARFDSAETRKDWNCHQLSGGGWKANLSSQHISYQCVSPAAPLLLPWIILTGSCVQHCQPKGTRAMGLWTLRYPGRAGVFCKVRRKERCLDDGLVAFKVYLGLSLRRQKLWLQSCSAGTSHQHYFLLCFMRERRIKL